MITSQLEPSKGNGSEKKLNGESVPAQPSCEKSEEPLPSVPDEDAKDRTYELLSDLDAEFSYFKEVFEERLKYDSAKEEAFDYLYKELDDLKKNAAFDQVRPLYIDLILLFDRIESIRKDIDLSSPSTISLPETFKTLNDELLEILLRRGVELIKTSAGPFNPKCQQAIATQPTSLESEDSLVASVVRRGFRYGDRIIRPEEVVVNKYEPVHKHEAELLGEGDGSK